MEVQGPVPSRVPPEFPEATAGSRKEELDDPWCFGFFVDNEISWGGETALAEWTLQSPATQPAKIEMVAPPQGAIRLHRQTQRGLARRTTRDWDALLQSQQKPPPGSKEDCVAFSAVVTEAYFRNIRDEFKAVAPDTLYLGCRFAGSTKAAVQIGAKYCDVISYNLYRHTLDDFKLPEGVDKPVMIGEFHFGALDRGLFHPSLIEVADQAARGKAYAAYIASALRHPNVIGAHWHQYRRAAHDRTVRRREPPEWPARRVRHALPRNDRRHPRGRVSTVRDPQHGEGISTDTQRTEVMS